MRVHRTISVDRPLLVVALEEEATHLHASELPILVTGVGKVNAAVAVATILGEHTPASIINVGTAGALRDDISGTHVISSVVQHDVDDAVLFDVTGLHFNSPLMLQESGLVLVTGDAFISDPAARARLALAADLVDMEGYAVARAAQAADVPVMLVKHVSDQADGSADRTWRQTVDDCAVELGIWLRDHLAH